MRDGIRSLRNQPASPKPPDDEQVKAWEPIFARLDEIKSLRTPFPKVGIDFRISELARQANETFSKLSLVPELGRLISGREAISDLWKKQFADIASIEPTLTAIQANFARIYEVSLLAERTLALIDFSHLFSDFDISNHLRKLASNSVSAFVESYSDLFATFKEGPAGVLSYAPVVSTNPPLEFYFNARLISPVEITADESPEDALISRKLLEETTGDLEKLLIEIDPALITLWRGARSVLESTHPDATRHFSVSLRELLTHVVHKLAPDDRVRAWTNAPGDFHEGKPKRRTRLRYICRDSNLQSFGNFVERDIDAVLACTTVLEEGTHSLNASLRRTQREWLLWRTEVTIGFLIRIFKETGKPS